jgi:hypothetical protein
VEIGFSCGSLRHQVDACSHVDLRWYKIQVRILKNSRDFVFADGVLPKKFKLLIAMSFDASYGAVNGVTSLAQQALEAGATKELLPKHWELHNKSVEVVAFIREDRLRRELFGWILYEKEILCLSNEMQRQKIGKIPK